MMEKAEDAYRRETENSSFHPLSARTPILQVNLPSAHGFVRTVKTIVLKCSLAECDTRIIELLHGGLQQMFERRKDVARITQPARSRVPSHFQPELKIVT